MTDRLRKAAHPFVALYLARRQRYAKRGGDLDTYREGHPAFDIKAGELPLGLWRELRAALDAEPKTVNFPESGRTRQGYVGKPSPSDEERAWEIYDEALRGGTDESIHHRIPRMFAEAFREERARCRLSVEQERIHVMSEMEGCDAVELEALEMAEGFMLRADAAIRGLENETDD